MKKLTAIDLFSGAGGLSKGFLDAGYEIIVGVDNDQPALNTFVKNHNGAVALNADLSKQDTFDEIKRIAGERSIDVVIAGPPCQGFSLSGPRNFDDERNKLYLAVIEIVRQFQPKGFIIENVPGMATLYNGKIKDEILRRFDNMGYNIKCRILCAADYGVPQIRKRLIFMGVRKDIGYPKFPEPVLKPENYLTCRDAISDLPSLENEIGSDESTYNCSPKTDYQKLMRGNNNVLYNHLGTNHTQMVVDTIALVPEGGNYKDLPKGWGESRKFHMAWTRLNGNAPARTVDTGHRNLFHYKYNRVPTVRESARMQSFPDNFIFTGNKTQQSRQVGNAVPPLLGQALGEALLNIISEKVEMSNERIKSVDLFAGCGGLMDGFEQSGYFNTIAAVEWEKAPCKNMENRLKNKWGYTDAQSRVLRFDIQRTDELFRGWKDDIVYGESSGLDKLVNDVNGIDMIIGGPPCQAYSIAGRVRDSKGMKDDYRNYLFESYIKVLKRYKPKAFIFENVPGILSAQPGKELIIDVIKKSFDNAGYMLLDNLNNAIIDFSDYGVPQNRKRLIIFGVRKECFFDKSEEIVHYFYETALPKYKVKKKRTVYDAISDLPKLYPCSEEKKVNGTRTRHTLPETGIANHVARWQSDRDISIFKLLAEDIESGRNEYTTTESLKKLYTDMTGKTSNIHKYHVVKWDEPSNLIPAHLYKDGLRHIHPDSRQQRSLTVREAARLQTFDDDYIFEGSNMELYKMIGNAVPPLAAKCCACAVVDTFKKYSK